MKPCADRHRCRLICTFTYTQKKTLVKKAKNHKRKEILNSHKENAEANRSLEMSWQIEILATLEALALALTLAQKPYPKSSFFGFLAKVRLSRMKKTPTKQQRQLSLFFLWDPQRAAIEEKRRHGLQSPQCRPLSVICTLHEEAFAHNYLLF
jgi:hypothetical protein